LKKEVVHSLVFGLLSLIKCLLIIDTVARVVGVGEKIYLRSKVGAFLVDLPECKHSLYAHALREAGVDNEVRIAERWSALPGG